MSFASLWFSCSHHVFAFSGQGRRPSLYSAVGDPGSNHRGFLVVFKKVRNFPKTPILGHSGNDDIICRHTNQHGMI